MRTVLEGGEGWGVGRRGWEGEVRGAKRVGRREGSMVVSHSQVVSWETLITINMTMTIGSRALSLTFRRSEVARAQLPLLFV